MTWKACSMMTMTPNINFSSSTCKMVASVINDGSSAEFASSTSYVQAFMMTEMVVAMSQAPQVTQMTSVAQTVVTVCKVMTVTQPHVTGA